MNNFWQQIIWGNTVQDYVWTIGVILFVLLVNKYLSRYLAIFFCKIFGGKYNNFNQEKLTRLIIHPLGVFLVVAISVIMLYRLSFPEEMNIVIYKYSIQQVLLTVANIIQIGAFIWLLWRIIDFIASVLENRANKTPDLGDNQLIYFFKDFLKVFLSIVGFLMILHFAFDYNIGSLVTGLSIVGAAIALALRESLENLIASFVIFFDKPFTTGDLVNVQNITGNVERIGLRSTRIRTTDKSYVTVPNKKMVDSILDNISLRSQIKGTVELNLNLQSSHEKIELILQEVKNYLSNVKEIQTYNVFFNDIKIQAYVLQIEFFTSPVPPTEFSKIKEGLNLFILKTIENFEVKT
jgi:MscS family membrane protein